MADEPEVPAVEEPITWRVLQAVKSMVQQITPGNGYYTSIGTGTILTDRSRFRLRGNGAVTLIVADDLALNDAASGPRTKAWDMDFVVEVAVPYGAGDPELIAHRARADLVRALNTDLHQHALARFRTLVVTGSSFDSAADEGSEFTVVQVTARAGLTETATPAP